MIPIYMHEYTFTPDKRNKLGIQSVVVIKVTSSPDREPFVFEDVDKFLDQDASIEHRILLEGYKAE